LVEQERQASEPAPGQVRELAQEPEQVLVQVWAPVQVQEQGQM
jgi:hypothetical protein